MRVQRGPRYRFVVPVCGRRANEAPPGNCGYAPSQEKEDTLSPSSTTPYTIVTFL